MWSANGSGRKRQGEESRTASDARPTEQSTGEPECRRESQWLAAPCGSCPVRRVLRPDNAQPDGQFIPSASGAGTSFTPGATAGALAAAAPPNFTSPEEAKLDPRYRTGGDGEDLFSGNYHWSLPLVSLPGRNGLDLNLTLHYNSLVWIRHSGNIISFDYDYYPTLTPGFRLGFPEISGPATTIGSFETYIVILPTGRRVALRKVTTSRYEATDSSYLYLVTSPSTQTMTLYATDGTQFSYTIPAGDWWYRCTQIKDRNGNFLTISYANVGTAEDPLFSIGTITDTLGRVINFNYQNQRLLSITQEWHGQTHTWAQFDYPAAGQEHPMTPNFGSLLVDGRAAASGFRSSRASSRAMARGTPSSTTNGDRRRKSGATAKPTTSARRWFMPFHRTVRHRPTARASRSATMALPGGPDKVTSTGSAG